MVGGLGIPVERAGDSVTQHPAQSDPGQLTRPRGPRPSPTPGGRLIALPVRPEPRRGHQRPDLARDERRSLAIEDRRFLRPPGRGLAGRCGRWSRTRRPATSLQGASTLTQQYVKNYMLYVDAQTEAERLKATEQTPARKLKRPGSPCSWSASCPGRDPQPLPQHRLHGQRVVRRRGRRADVLQHDGQADRAAERRCLAGMVPFHDPVRPHPEPADGDGRRNLVIRSCGSGHDQRPAGAGEGRGVAAGCREPAGQGAERLLGAGDMGFFCKYVVSTSTRPASPRNRSTGATTPSGRRSTPVMTEVSGPSTRRCRRTPATSRTRYRWFQPGAGEAPGAGGRLQPDVRAQRRRQGISHQATVPAGQPGCRLPRTRCSPRRQRWRRASASTTRCGAAVRVRLTDLRRRRRPADPGRQRRRGPPPARMSMTDALAQSPNTAFIKLEEFTGVPGRLVDIAVRLGMKSLATTPFVVESGERTDRSIAEVIRATASFTLGVTPTVLELTRTSGPPCSPAGQVVPADADRLDHRRERPEVPIARPCQRAVDPALAGSPWSHRLSRTTSAWPGRSRRRAAGWNRPMAGKTGTTPTNTSPRRSWARSRRCPARSSPSTTRTRRALCATAAAPRSRCSENNIFPAADTSPDLGTARCPRWWRAHRRRAAARRPTRGTSGAPSPGSGRRGPLGRRRAAELEGAGWQVTAGRWTTGPPGDGRQAGPAGRGAAGRAGDAAGQQRYRAGPPPPPGQPTPGRPTPGGPPPPDRAGPRRGEGNGDRPDGS
ncbi:hypothetical protein HBB16_12275 [Pseudonocardia sp. MCCB 268]|nr:hypothetical protein [Pseudonocardia cytotoxica]